MNNGLFSEPRFSDSSSTVLEEAVFLEATL
jgi:hypothetical protein